MSITVRQAISISDVVPTRQYSGQSRVGLYARVNDGNYHVRSS
nr:hypothetical protein [Mycobacterium simulans]